MKPAHAVLSFGFAVVSSVVAQATTPAAPALAGLDLTVHPGYVQFDVLGPAEPFVGVVLVSLQPELVHFLVGLPPLLDQSLVLDYGISSAGTFTSVFPEAVFPPGLMIYAQGVTISDAGIASSMVRDFVLDGSGQK